jgi:hypothetical protein
LSFSFNNNGFISQNSRVKSEVKWSYVKEIIQRKDFFIIKGNIPGVSSVFLPKRAFIRSEDLNAFISLTKEKRLLK